MNLTVAIPIYAARGRTVADGPVRAQALVDAADADWVGEWRWYLHERRYVSRRTGESVVWRYAVRDGGKIRMHRLICSLPFRSDGREVDHVNRDGLDNRRSNLRVVTHAQNLQNKASYRGASSLARGVYWHGEKQRWAAQVGVNGRHHHLGYFTNEDEAAQIASDYRKKIMPFAVERDDGALVSAA